MFKKTLQSSIQVKMQSLKFVKSVFYIEKISQHHTGLVVGGGRGQKVPKKCHEWPLSLFLSFYF